MVVYLALPPCLSRARKMAASCCAAVCSVPTAGGTKAEGNAAAAVDAAVAGGGARVVRVCGLGGYLSLVLVGVAVVAQSGEAIDEGRDVALRGRRGSVQDGSPVGWGADQGRHQSSGRWTGECGGGWREAQPGRPEG